MFSQKGTVPLIIILITVAILSYGAYYLKSQSTRVTPLTVNNTQEQSLSEEIRDWKKYTNNEYKYTLKYPPQVSHEQKVGTVQYSKSHDFFRVDGGTLEIYGTCGTGNKPLKQSDITIAGKKTTTLLESETVVLMTINRPTPHANDHLCFNLTLTEDTSKANSAKKLFYQILSTFEFTN